MGAYVPQNSGKIFFGNYHEKFGHFSGKYAKFGDFVNFSGKHIK